MKFSIVLIARNEEKTLPRLIESLGEFRARGGEIVLVDTNSTDKTVEVAKSLGVKVHEVGDRFRIEPSASEVISMNDKFVKGNDPIVIDCGETLFDFASARNFAASLAENDMIAMPDCDEIYTKLNLDEIEKQIEEGAEQFEYHFIFSHDEEGVPVIEFAHSKFYDRRKMKWTGVIHEVLTSSESVNRVKLPQEVIKLEHYQNEQTNRSGYLKGLAYDCFKNPENDRNAHYFGRELFYRGYHESAIAQLLKHVEMKKWNTEASESWNYIGESYLALGKEDLARDAFLRAFDLEPNRREPLMKIADIYYKKRSAEHVIAYVAATLQVKGGDFYANFAPYYEHLPHEMMYWALWQKGEVLASKKHFDLCIGYQPFASKYLHDFRFYYELPKISFVMEKKTSELSIQSILGLNYPQEKIEIISLEDNGETKTPSGDWVVRVNGEMVFETDSLISIFRTAMENGKYFMQFNTGKKGKNEVFIIHKKLIAKFEKNEDVGEAMWCKRAVVNYK